MPFPNLLSAPFVRTLLRPGQTLMCALRLPGKLTLLTAALVLPLAVLALAAVYQANDDLDFTAGERAGARVVQQLGQAAFQTLSLRTPQADTAAAQAALHATLQALDTEIKATTGSTGALPFTLAEPWAPVHRHLQALADGQHPADPAEATRQTDLGVDAVHALMHQVGERSGLLFDPEPLSYFLMELMVERLLPLSQAVAELDQPGPADAASVAALRMRSDDLERLRADFAMRLASVRGAGGTVPDEWTQAEAAIGRLLSAGRDGAAPSPEADAALHAAAADATRALQATGERIMAALDQQLQARATAIRTRLAWQMGALGAGVATLLYLATCFRASYAEALRNLHAALAAMARGDLAQPVQVPGRDEVAEIGRLAETVAERLSGIVCEIRSSAMRLSQTGESVAASAAALAERSEEQATNLVQTSRTVGSLSEAVASNAEASNALDRTTRLLRTDAHHSGQSMQAMVAAMNSLQAVSRRAGEAVDAINAIAFRTNLLALNAAVEAARAGESGRGFAVVAGEVRQLAQRSAEAAREVRSLLEGIGSEVAGSSQRLQNAGTALGTLLKGVDEVSNELRHIAERSSGQSQGLAEVAQSVGSLDVLTRRNQAMVNESTLAALELMDRAGSLSGTVSAIRLRQGSADEARNLVERAHSLVQRQGLGPAMTAMRGPEAGFVDRDLYVFITDGQGVYRLHTAAPAKEGRRVHEAPGIDGDAFVRDAHEAAHGSHWVDYTITNPTTGLPQRKTSYVVALEGDLVLGCGFYRHDVNASLALEQQAETEPA